VSELVAVSGPDFHGHAHVDDGRIAVTLTGTAALGQQEQVTLVLGRVHEEALRARPREVVVDLRGLEFMNSSCFKCFVGWIGNIRKLETDAQYKVAFVSNPKIHWQKRSLDALRCFAVDLISIGTA
jgi:hypothetical protein